MLCLSSRKISHKELDMVYNSNKNHEELLESKWLYFLCKTLISQKHLIHSEGSI